MKLSVLVYEIVKNVKYLDDPGFTYDSFLRGDFDNDRDYSNSINNAFSPLNEAIHRLSDRNKLGCEIVEIGKPNNNGIIDISNISKDIKSIVAVLCLYNYNYSNVEFRQLGKDKILIINNNSGFENNVLMIQYKKDIPFFTKQDIYYYEDNNNTLESKDVELKDYGISNTMCSYIIEYCQGKLQETIAPELANMHLTRAEQYFDDLEDQQLYFHQQRVTPKYKI